MEVIVNNLCDNKQAPLNERIESARTKIFDFDYPVPERFYSIYFKQYFETQFINEYLFREIGYETVERFKQRLMTRCTKIMPRYKTLFDMIDNIDWDNFFKNIDYNETLDTDYAGKNESNSDTNDTSSHTRGDKLASSNLPENMLANGEIGDFTNVEFADNASIGQSRDDAQSNGNMHTKGNNESVTNTVINRSGRNMSYATFLAALPPKTFKYFEQLINEFRDLFMVLIF